ncbi:MAG: hypothetical protein AAGK32_18980, partial [Actinomycetota bacterium]
MVVPFALAAVLAVLGARRLAIVVAAAAILLTAVRLARPGWVIPIDRFLVAFGRRVGGFVSVILLAFTFALLVLPAWVIARLLRWEPLILERAGAWMPGAGRSNRFRRRSFQRELVDRPAVARVQGMAVGVALAV